MALTQIVTGVIAALLTIGVGYVVLHYGRNWLRPGGGPFAI